MSRWTTTEVALLVHEAPLARTPEDLRPLFSRHSLLGVRAKARRCGVAWPKRARVNQLPKPLTAAGC